MKLAHDLLLDVVFVDLVPSCLYVLDKFVLAVVPRWPPRRRGRRDDCEDEFIEDVEAGWDEINVNKIN